MGRRAGIVLLALLGTLVGLGFGAGTAAADDGTTTTVTPSTNLAASQTVSVSGTGFGANQPGTIRQAIEIGGNLQFGPIVANFTTDSNGSFGPVAVTVSRTFTTIANTQVTCSTTQPCTILASTDQTEQADHAPITFAAPQQTSLCSQLQTQSALLNARITAIESTLPTNLSPEQKAAYIARLEVIRAQANAQLNAALAGAGCPVT
ncbi:MAG: Neocarzinostatin family [Actinomycetota bacterium]|jgi:hypothetical protein|nr:Neocarzinostatin family [Actinomycetota bacterium]